MRKRKTVIALGIATCALVASVFAIKHIVGNGHTAIREEAVVPNLQNGGASPNPWNEVLRLRAEIRKHPKDASLHEELAVLLFGLGRRQEAISEFQTAISIAPGVPSSHYMLARAYEESGKTKDGIREAIVAAELGQRSRADKEATPPYSLFAGQMLHEAGHFEQAEVHYEMALAQLSASAPEWKVRGFDQLNKTGDFARVLRQQACDGLVTVRKALGPSRPSAEWVRRQVPYLSLPLPHDPGNDAKCRELEAKIVAGREGGESAHLELGNCYLRSGNADGAAVEFLAATQLSPDSPVSWFNLGIAYLLQGRLDAATDAFRKAGSLGDKKADTLASAVRRMTESRVQKRD